MRSYKLQQPLPYLESQDPIHIGRSKPHAFTLVRGARLRRGKNNTDQEGINQIFPLQKPIFVYKPNYRRVQSLLKV